MVEKAGAVSRLCRVFPGKGNAVKETTNILTFRQPSEVTQSTCRNSANWRMAAALRIGSIRDFSFQQLAFSGYAGAWAFRRKAIAPRATNPAIIISQVDGSGTESKKLPVN